MRHFLVIGLLASASPAASDVSLVSDFVWRFDDDRFGGFSAIEMADDGASFTALSDRGNFVRATVSRQDNQISDVQLLNFYRLTDENGRGLMHAFNDSEGLADLGNGSFAVSFEWTHGLRTFDSIATPPSPLITAPGFSIFQPNSSLEALAVDREGSLYTIPERSGRAEWPFPVYRYKDDEWRIAFEIPRHGSFLIAGADFGPDGRLYVLERDFLGIGFRSRVRSFEVNGSDERTVLQTGPLVHDNLEGISVWQSGDDIMLSLISDDNFSAIQRTELVEYRLTQN
ncbi:esterase-like activity of phytase family protein [Yoonia litorea]|uniref:Phytase-like domain-containing protein n=1 Tax=Yoonia litorea TaxID=1123755 RepID=A0A1I6MU55_9RHOB|nr:esterase-like activity of phytase family protein [Yoonia litorea]SFS19068.1 hypothetical protein SAMN05444714_2089 [Yoonia litorea]